MAGFHIIKEAGGKFYIAEQTFLGSEKYLIECDSQADADQVILRLGSGNLPSPIHNPTLYDKIGFDVMGKVPIYRVK